jgi:hypothetical protein
LKAAPRASLGEGMNAIESVKEDLQRSSVVRTRREPKVRFKGCAGDNAGHRFPAPAFRERATYCRLYDGSENERHFKVQGPSTLLDNDRRRFDGGRCPVCSQQSPLNPHVLLSAHTIGDLSVSFHSIMTAPTAERRRSVPGANGLRPF